VQRVIELQGQASVLEAARKNGMMPPTTIVETAIECKRLGYLTISFDFIASVTEKGREFLTSI
jgi:hypothetical protein